MGRAVAAVGLLLCLSHPALPHPAPDIPDTWAATFFNLVWSARDDYDPSILSHPTQLQLASRLEDSERDVQFKGQTLTPEQIVQVSKALIGNKEEPRLAGWNPSPDAVVQCNVMAMKFNVKPRTSWGSLPSTMQPKWTQLNCDALVQNRPEAAIPPLPTPPPRPQHRPQRPDVPFAAGAPPALTGGKHDWCVLMTATVNPFIDLKARHGWNQQRNPAQRRRTYENSVERWATQTRLPVIFVENSDADLSTIQAKVPQSRRLYFEFLHSKKAFKETDDWTVLDMGRQEALSILGAVEQSRILKHCTRMLKVTGRFFVHDMEKQLAKCGPDADIAIQEPSWKTSWDRQETQVLGLRISELDNILGWAKKNGVDGVCFECQMTYMVRDWKQHLLPKGQKHMCKFPALTVDPVNEGSIGTLRNQISASDLEG